MNRGTKRKKCIYYITLYYITFDNKEMPGTNDPGFSVKMSRNSIRTRPESKKVFNYNTAVLDVRSYNYTVIKTSCLYRRRGNLAAERTKTTGEKLP